MHIWTRPQLCNLYVGHYELLCGAYGVGKEGIEGGMDGRMEGELVQIATDVQVYIANH